MAFPRGGDCSARSQADKGAVLVPGETYRRGGLLRMGAGGQVHVHWVDLDSQRLYWANRWRGCAQEQKAEA